MMTEQHPAGYAPPAVQNGTYTISSERTGAHATFRIRTVRRGKLAGKRIVEQLTGPCNETNYTGVAFWDDGGARFNVWRRFATGNGSINPGFFSGDWNPLEKKLGVMLELALDRPPHFDWSAKGYSLHAEGTCLKCNRKLTTPDSIRLGIGPVCLEKMGAV